MLGGEGWGARERGNEARRAKARGPGEGRGDGKPLHSRQKSQKYGNGILKSGLTRKPLIISVISAENLWLTRGNSSHRSPAWESIKCGKWPFNHAPQQQNDVRIPLLSIHQCTLFGSIVRHWIALSCVKVLRKSNDSAHLRISFNYYV